MANIYGIEYLSPEEVQMQEQQQLQQAKAQAQDPVSLARIAQQESIMNLFGSPARRKAEATQQALGQIGTLEKAPGESEIDFQVRQASEVRKALASVDPSLAMQANAQILALQQGKLEQDKLLAETEGKTLGNEGKKIDNQDAAFTAKMLQRRYITKVDPKTGIATPVRGFDPDASEEEIIAQLRDLQQLHPDQSFDITDGVQAFTQDDIASMLGRGRTGGGPSVFEQKELKSIYGAISTSWNFEQVVERLGSVPDALVSVVSSTGGTLDAVRGAVNEVRTITEAGSGKEGLELEMLQRENQRVQDRFLGSEDQAVLRAAQERGIQASVLQGQILTLAYQLAKTLDPGGRLSDQDVSMAKQMIMGSGSAESVAELLEVRRQSMELDLGYALDSAKNGYFGERGLEAYNKFKEQDRKTAEALLRFVENLKSKQTETAATDAPTTGGGFQVDQTAVEAELRRRGL